MTPSQKGTPLLDRIYGDRHPNTPRPATGSTVPVPAAPRDTRPAWLRLLKAKDYTGNVRSGLV